MNERLTIEVENQIYDCLGDFLPERAERKIK